MKLSISTKSDAIKDGGGALDFIAEEGIFPISFNFVSVEETRNGAVQVNFNFQYMDKPQTIYGPIIKNKDGSTNTIGMSLINKLGVVAGLEDGADLTIEEESHAVGKDNEVREFNVITDFSDLDVFAHVVREYTKYNNDVQRRLSMRNVFHPETKASASEIADDSDSPGKQYALTLEKYCVPVYRDGVTAEEAEEYEAAQRAARSGGKTPAPTSKIVNKKARAFGARS